MAVATISPTQLDEIRKNGRPVELIDVRPPVDFQTMHVEFARNVPIDSAEFDALAAERNGTADEPLYVICRRGILASRACEKLTAAGCDNVVNVAGGTEGWERAGLPVVRNVHAMSLERQVRIAAGFLVLVGTLLGAFAHVYFLAIPAFVGAGLMFAGITNTCGMGMLLAKMPWNQVGVTHGKETQQSCST